jgi:hypothetical protein
MIQSMSPVASVDPSALLSALESAKSTTESQVRRLMTAMVRIHDADARFDNAQAKYELGGNALLLYRIHTMLFGTPAGGAGSPVSEAPPPAPMAPASGEVAQAYGEFQSLRVSMLQAAAQVDALLAKVEQGLAEFEQKWKAAP